MNASEKPKFVQLLTDVLAGYGKPLPEKSILDAWWNNLAPFPLRIVAAAFVAYSQEPGEYLPIPVGIAKRCRLMDGRPTADEAWAIALTSRNEADTVVWTSETAEAFSLCYSVLQTGDKVGARRSFIDAYERLVTAARVDCKPAAWSVSLGWDMRKRESAVTRAQVAGLLSAPAAQALLPNYTDSGEPAEKSPEGLAKLKEELAKLQAGWSANAERRAAEVIAEREAETQRKREIAEQVAQYQNDNQVQA